MRKAIYIAVAFTSAGLLLNAQVSRKGAPLIQNYTTEQFPGSEQNWAVVQDDRGVMYFGNNDRGVLEYDGESWRRIPVPNNSIVRSLAYHNGLIYVGTVDEFGYLAPDEIGQLTYHSLSCQLDSSVSKFGDVWNTYACNNQVFFSTDLDRLFIYENLTFRKSIFIPYRLLFTFSVNERVYAGTFVRGLMELKGDSFVTVKNGEFFAGKNILSILPHRQDELQLGITPGGVFIYNTVTGEVSTGYPSATANAFLDENLIYDAISLPDGQAAYATLNRGALIIDRQGNIRHILDKQAGLQNEIVSSLFFNRDGTHRGPMWLTLSSGISKAEINSPVAMYGENFGIKGSILDINIFKDIMYIATLSGLYYMIFDRNNVPTFHPVTNVENSCWSLLKFRKPDGEEVLLAATSPGIYEISDTNRVTSIEDMIFTGRHMYYNAFKLQPSILHPNRIYVGIKTGLVSLAFVHGHWRIDQRFRQVPKYEVRSIAEDTDGTIWLGTLVDGLVRVTPSGTDTVVRVYNQKDHLPSVKDNFVFRYRNDLIFGTQGGILRYDRQGDFFYRDTIFPSSYSNGSKGLFRFVEARDNRIWTVVLTEEKKWIERLEQTADGEFKVDSISLKRLSSRDIDAVFPDAGGTTWFGISNRLFSFTDQPPGQQEDDLRVLIRKVVLNDERTVNAGFVPEKFWNAGAGAAPEYEASVPEFSYRFNNISFEYAAPFFIEEGATTYSHYLEGLHKSWSRWSGESKVPFNNLREGRYHFHVKAKNIYGQESAIATYSFVINPPWFRTRLAYLLYIAALVGLIYLIVKFYSRRLILEKQRLERIVSERTREVVEQKKEIEKQRDVANRQKEKIEIQNVEIKDSIKYASRIQKAILPPGDYLSDLIPESFILNLPKDIVSGDFYWFSEKEYKIIIALADCTGHGVPGAFMSMLGMAFLNEIVNQNNIVQPGEILNHLRIHVINALHQTGGAGETRDGMDISLFSLDLKNHVLEFAGAYNPLVIIDNHGLTSIKGDFMPIGISDRLGQPFTNHMVNISKGTAVYAYSDGYADQFGGPANKKFNSKNLKNLLLEISSQPLANQKVIMEQRFNQWKGAHEQVDDILVLGIRI